MENVLKQIENLNLKSEYENVQLVVNLDVYKQPTQFVINFPDCEDSINSFKAKAKKILKTSNKSLISSNYEKYLAELSKPCKEHYCYIGKEKYVFKPYSMREYDKLAKQAITVLKDKQGKLSKTNQDFHNQIALLLRNDKSSIDFWKLIKNKAIEREEITLHELILSNNYYSLQFAVKMFDFYYINNPFEKQYKDFSYFCPIQLYSFVHENKNLFKHLFNNQ